MPSKVVAVDVKPTNACSQYWLRVENGKEVPCTQREYWAAKNALNSGGFHVVNVQ
ncbi:hypothetical protein [Allocoleopsis sp.]|uniref:hypothetical protein n=1 Tax=Allocoleopsis sp. TaxID=3088169 RepID=UPI002FD59708